jgi:hypothetical protein
MSSHFIPSFEVVKEGRILKNIKHLKTQIECAFCEVVGSGKNASIDQPTPA